MPLHVRTPLVLHPALSTAERRVWLKLENLQPSGSFKTRGIGRLCELAKAEGKTRLVAPSGGNAGIAAAYAGRQLGMPVEVIVPETTGADTRRRIAALGAQVTVHGKVWDEANALALERATGGDAQYIPAFDHPAVWEGHSTLIDELVEQLPDFDALVCSVGGGGLLAGMMIGLERHGRADCKLVAAETEGAASFRAALDAGKPVKIAAITSIAKTLGALQVAAWPVEAAARFPLASVVLSDAASLDGVVRYADDMRQLVEPACGVSLAVAYGNHPALAGACDVVIVVCGGTAVDTAQVEAWRAANAHAAVPSMALQSAG
jgi:L-serine/L-threonine ammonia-lyase